MTGGTTLCWSPAEPCLPALGTGPAVTTARGAACREETPLPSSLVPMGEGVLLPPTHMRPGRVREQSQAESSAPPPSALFSRGRQDDLGKPSSTLHPQELGVLGTRLIGVTHKVYKRLLSMPHT